MRFQPINGQIITERHLIGLEFSWGERKGERLLNFPLELETWRLMGIIRALLITHLRSLWLIDQHWHDKVLADTVTCSDVSAMLYVANDKWNSSPSISVIINCWIWICMMLHKHSQYELITSNFPRLKTIKLKFSTNRLRAQNDDARLRCSFLPIRVSVCIIFFVWECTDCSWL